MFSTYYLLNILSAGIKLSLACILLSANLPKRPEWMKFRIVNRIIALACFLLFCSDIAEVFTHDESQTLLSLILICVSPIQALLFTATTLVMILPSVITWRWVFINLVPIFFCCTVLIGTYLFFPEELPFLQLFMTLAYMGQMAYYTVLYMQSRKESTHILNSVYDEELSYRLRWADTMFFFALAVGLFAFVWALCNAPAIKISFLVFSTFFYLFSGIRCIRYPMNESYLMKAFTTIESSHYIESSVTAKSAKVAPEINEQEILAIQSKVERWVADGRCFVAELTVDEIIEEMGISTKQFNLYFNLYLGTHFRTWRSNIRIQEAQRLLTENPDISTGSLLDQTGIADRSNFHKAFRQAVGCTVAEFRNQQR